MMMEDHIERVPINENTPFITKLFKRIVGLEMIYFTSSISSIALKYRRDNTIKDYDYALAGAIVYCHDSKSRLPTGDINNMVAFYNNFVVIQHTASEASLKNDVDQHQMMSENEKIPEHAMYFMTFICKNQNTAIDAVIDMAPQVLFNLKQSVTNGSIEDHS
mmetsp:Transcript_901/g.1418  ORF Transcript_901/g.1418 Transcript_901/m.1418 type:complete len:162 (-) Transcript_901:43-528(-)